MSDPGGPQSRVISSPQNPLVRQARLLDHDRGERDRSGLFLAWGVHLAQEALAASAPVERAFVSPAATRTAEGAHLVDRLASGGKLVRTTDTILDAISGGAGDQGVVLVIRRSEPTLEQLLHGRPTLLMLAHGVQDPGNLGSIARTAHGLGAKGFLVLQGSANPYSSRAVRASMGAVFHLPVLASRFPLALQSARASGLALVAADASTGRLPADVDFRRSVALIVGGEGGGLPEELCGLADDWVRIPMAPGAESLNVHAAAAILLYEVARQRRQAALR